MCQCPHFGIFLRLSSPAVKVLLKVMKDLLQTVGTTYFRRWFDNNELNIKNFLAYRSSIKR